MNPSDQKAVIVTGSSRGIGRAIALRLASDGYAVTVNYAGNQKTPSAPTASVPAAQAAPTSGQST